MSNTTIKIGTRGSKLALYQAFLVQEELQKHYPDTTFVIEIIKTKGGSDSRCCLVENWRQRTLYQRDGDSSFQWRH